MKKIYVLVIALVIICSMMGIMSVSAADNKISAKAGVATVDGVISEGEYGDVFVMNGSIGGNFAGDPLSGTYDWQFAWAEDALYVGIKYDEATNYGPFFQMCFAPVANDKMPADQEGLFYTAKTDGTAVTLQQHHHNTNLADANATIQDKTETAVKKEGTIVTIEFKIPVASFQIKGVCEDFKFAAGELSGAIVMMEAPTGNISATGSTSVSTIGSKFPELDLGKITLNELPPEPTEAPATEVPATEAPEATKAPANEEKGGCGSSSAIAQVMLVLGAALIIKKKK